MSKYREGVAAALVYHFFENKFFHVEDGLTR